VAITFEVPPRAADDLRPHQQQPYRRLRVEFQPAPPLVPLPVQVEAVEQPRRFRVVNAHGGHLLGRRDLYAASALGGVVLDGVKQHRANVVRRGL
jgi:hypothetical protein